MSVRTRLSSLALPVLAAGLLAGCAPAEGGTADEAAPAAADAESDAAESDAAGMGDADVQDGFELLIEGSSLAAWRGFRRDDVPGGWSAEDGVLAYTPGVESGDIITRETFTDFDLRLEWRIEEGGNSGIMFGVSEDTRRTYESGPEMQILDNATHPDGRSPLTSAGSNYALNAPARDVTRPVGEWNEARLRRRGNTVEHWLNGEKIVEYEIGSDAWKEGVAGSKFAQWPDYGMHPDGHIALQDHGNPVWFRNVRIRRLP